MAEWDLPEKPRVGLTCENHCKTPQYWNKRQNPHNHLDTHTKSFDKIQHSFTTKQKTKSKKGLCQPAKAPYKTTQLT